MIMYHVLSCTSLIYSTQVYSRELNSMDDLNYNLQCDSLQKRKANKKRKYFRV